MNQSGDSAWMFASASVVIALITGGVLGGGAASVIGGAIGNMILGFVCASLVAGISIASGKKMTKPQFAAVMAVGCFLGMLAIIVNKS